MDFWAVIETHAGRPFRADKASAAVEAALRDLGPEQVSAFCRSFDEKLRNAYTWDLWGVAYLINGGCGDDSFMDFRASLIGLGEDVYEAAVVNAESLMALDAEQLEALFEEGFLYCGTSAYEALTGGAPDTGVAVPAEPSGEPWEESREGLAARFPRAWSVYGWEASSEPESPAPARAKPWWKFW